MDIKSKINNYYNKLLCSTLLIKNLFFKKELTIKSFCYITQLTHRGNNTELTWKAIGCYKIKIKNYGVLHGHKTFVNLILEKSENLLEITFYGIGGQKKIKKIEIEAPSPSISDTFLPNIFLSNLSSVPLMREDLKKTLDNSLNYQVPKQIILNQPKILFKDLRVNFEPFIKSNYPIKP